MGEMTMIERGVRAILRERFPTYVDDAHWAEHWSWYVQFRGQGGSADHSTFAGAERTYRAVLEAMREPTRTVVDAALHADPDDGGWDQFWKLMVDAALAEEPRPCG